MAHIPVQTSKVISQYIKKARSATFRAASQQLAAPQQVQMGNLHEFGHICYILITESSSQECMSYYHFFLIAQTCRVF